MDEDEDVEIKEEEEDEAVNPHPYAHLLSEFRPNPWQLKFNEPVKSPPIETTALTIVNTTELLKKMLDQLNQVTEFSVDVMHVSTTFQGVIGILLISTRTVDFIVDSLELKDELHILNEIFLNSNILKVMQTDYRQKTKTIKWLHRDFGLCIVNMFDVAVAEKEIGCTVRNRYKRASLANILKSQCKVTICGEENNMDRKIRPLSKAVIAYAREGIRHLLHLYDIYRNTLIAKGTLVEVYMECNGYCGAVWSQAGVDWHEGKYKKTLSLYNEKEFNEQQVEAFRLIFNWRWKVAERNDIGLNHVLANRQLAKLARRLPHTSQEVASCLAGFRDNASEKVPEFVTHFMTEILEFIAEAIDKYPNASEPVIGSRFKGGLRCFVCKERGHKEKHCPVAGVKCFACNKKGHKEKQCPNNKGSSKQRSPMRSGDSLNGVGSMQQKNNDVIGNALRQLLQVGQQVGCTGPQQGGITLQLGGTQLDSIGQQMGGIGPQVGGLNNVVLGQVNQHSGNGRYQPYGQHGRRV